MRRPISGFRASGTDLCFDHEPHEPHERVHPPAPRHAAGVLKGQHEGREGHEVWVSPDRSTSFICFAFFLSFVSNLGDEIMARLTPGDLRVREVREVRGQSLAASMRLGAPGKSLGPRFRGEERGWGVGWLALVAALACPAVALADTD